jgi:hypothetical protein
MEVFDWLYNPFICWPARGVVLFFEVTPDGIRYVVGAHLVTAFIVIVVPGTAHL